MKTTTAPVLIVKCGNTNKFVTRDATKAAEVIAAHSAKCAGEHRIATL